MNVDSHVDSHVTTHTRKINPHINNDFVKKKVKVTLVQAVRPIGGVEV